MKKRLVIALAVILVVGCLLALMPWSRYISVTTTVYEYALDQTEPLAVHDVTVEGRYFYRLFREDVFDGRLTVSGYPETQDASVYIQFWNDENPGMISYQDPDGIPIWHEPLQFIYCNGDFSRFTIQVYEYTEDGSQASWDKDTGRVLCAGAADYKTMVEYTAQAGLHLEEIK